MAHPSSPWAPTPRPGSSEPLVAGPATPTVDLLPSAVAVGTALKGPSFPPGCPMPPLSAVQVQPPVCSPLGLCAPPAAFINSLAILLFLFCFSYLCSSSCWQRFLLTERGGGFCAPLSAGPSRSHDALSQPWSRKALSAFCTSGVLLSHHTQQSLYLAHDIHAACHQVLGRGPSAAAAASALSPGRGPCWGDWRSPFPLAVLKEMRALLADLGDGVPT